MARSPWVDDYIAAAKPFAQPILTLIRATVHRHCPDVEEAKKWSFPNFLYKGKMMCSMASFASHATMGFAHGELVVPDRSKARDAMGSFGRMTSVDDLPGDNELGAMIRKAAELIDAGVSPPGFVRKRAPRPAPQTPPALAAVLATSPKAQAVWDAFAPSHRREYCEWIAEAKRDETRDKRIAQAVEWLAEGKQRNWKYQG